jgi:hypothetical protein
VRTHSPRFRNTDKFLEGDMVMNLRRILATVLFTTLVLGLVSSSQKVVGQSPSQPSQADKREDETNLDTQLYLLLATNQGVDDTKLPAALEPIMKQLRASLPFRNYRLAATLINRVKNEGNLSLKWIGGPLFPSASASTGAPSFNDFSVDSVKLVRDGEGRELIRMLNFRFGARVPIQTATVASTGAGFPVINYESMGLNTDISFREGEPVIVGTLNLSPTGDAIILVMSAKRANR